MVLENGNEGGGDGTDNQKLENSIGENKSGKIDVEVGFHTAKETGGEEMISDQTEKGRGEIGSGDNKGGGENAFMFGLEKFF